MNDANLIERLVISAYNSGYYSGKGENGEPYHLAAIEERGQTRDRVLQRLADLRAALAALVEAVDKLDGVQDAAIDIWISNCTESAIEQARATLAAAGGEAGE
jgi:hypothetical protein